MSSPPSTLGKYQIIREIARSNDIVYEAYDPLMNRRVALKELAVPSGSTTQQRDERLKRFLREAKAAGSLAHPNIVTIYEVGEDAGRHYLVMEYLDGHTLRNELDARGFLPLDEALKVGESVLRGLEYAHQNGVIHRDIKPENIQMLSDGRVKLTDFGIARLTFEPNITMDGQVFGTPSYMSPEQVVGKDIDVRSDIFSVGVVLYEMLAGQKPFTGDSVVTITYAITNKEPDHPAQIPQGMWTVISKALDKTPALRYANTAEMLSALANAKDPANLYGPPQQTSMPSSTQQPNASNPFLPPPPINPYVMQQPYPAQVYDPMAPPPYPLGSYQPAPPVPGFSTAPYMPGQPPYPGAPTYPIDPYGPDPYTGQQAYTPQLQQIPVYYPPAPRKPWLTPEQKATFSKVVWTILLVGLLFLGLIWFLATVGNGVPQNSSPKPPSNVTPSQSPSADTSATADGSTANVPNASSLDSAIALLQKAQEDQDMDMASQEFSDSIRSFEEMGATYNRQGKSALAGRALNWAAKGQLLWACRLEDTDRVRARTLLYRARQEASPDSDVAQDIQREVNKLI